MIHPKNTNHIYGHDLIIGEFNNIIKSSKLHHAWLFCGPKGIGKATVAYNLIKILLNSEQLKNTGLILNNSHPDLFIIENGINDEKSNKEIKVDQVRKLLNFLHMTPVLAARKVVLIDPIDMLNNNGLNALLKVLEEPIGQTVFLLVCNSLAALPSTIKSRCSILKFKPLNKDNFEKVLISQNISNTDVKELYKICNGSLDVIKFINKYSNVDIITKIDQFASLSPDYLIKELLELRKILSDEESWQYFASMLLNSQLIRIRQNIKNLRDIDKLIEWYEETFKLLHDKKTFNLDPQNVAFSIFS